MQTWQDLDDELAVRREIIRAVADIRLKPAAYKGDRSPFGRHRLEWTWKFGPEHDDTTAHPADAAGPGEIAHQPAH